MKTFTSHSTQEEALSTSEKITGKNFYAGFQNSKKPVKSNRWFVCESTGQILYVFKCPKDGFCHGESILNELTIHSTLSSGGFNLVAIYEGLEKVLIDIISKNWDGCSRNRKEFAKANYIVSKLEATI
jgi:hypothetical protein